MVLLILVGVGTALYAFGVLLEALIEGHLRQHMASGVGIARSAG